MARSQSTLGAEVGGEHRSPGELLGGAGVGHGFGWKAAPDTRDLDEVAAFLGMRKGMSTHPLRCSTCDRECVYERCAPFGAGQETVYAVAWRCPEDHGSSLDVCPVGPLVPAPELCLK